jgi:hypothetical protein
LSTGEQAWIEALLLMTGSGSGKGGDSAVRRVAGSARSGARFRNQENEAMHRHFARRDVSIADGYCRVDDLERLCFSDASRLHISGQGEADCGGSDQIGRKIKAG